MHGKWGRFGAFIAAAILIVAAVVLGTENTTRGWTQILVQSAIIAVGVYATTFIVWPRSFFRRTPTQVAPPKALTEAVAESDLLDEDPAKVVAEAETDKFEPRRGTPERDERPVAVIEPRPAGSKPGSRVHIPESPTVRNPRGRPVGGHEPSRDFRWPAQR